MSNTFSHSFSDGWSFWKIDQDKINSTVTSNLINTGSDNQGIFLKKVSKVNYTSVSKENVTDEKFTIENKTLLIP